MKGILAKDRQPQARAMEKAIEVVLDWIWLVSISHSRLYLFVTRVTINHSVLFLLTTVVTGLSRCPNEYARPYA